MLTGTRFADLPDEQCLFLPPRSFRPCKAAMTKNLLNAGEQDPCAIAPKSHLTGGVPLLPSWGVSWSAQRT